jgi:hypothetical protein
MGVVEVLINVDNFFGLLDAVDRHTRQPADA